MVLVATLLTDVPLDERGFRAVLLNCSCSALAGAAVQDGLVARHSFGDAETDRKARDVRVHCRPAVTVPRAALVELHKHGFRPVTALEFHTSGDREAREDAWALLGLYCHELRGWALTWHLDFDEAAARAGSSDGLLHAPAGTRKQPAVLIAASTLKLLTP